MTELDLGEPPLADHWFYECSLYDYVQAAWTHIESAPFINNWHIEALAEHLQAVTTGQIQNLLINIPPGCSKSLMCCVLWPTWEWCRDPSVRFMFASYDQQLATRDSVKCRALMSSPWYRGLWPDKVQFKRDQDQKTYYETISGGYRLATSIGGHGTGEHPDRIVCLPAESCIITTGGALPIGKVVSDRLPVRVLGYSHVRGITTWQDIESFECSPGRPLLRIGFDDGTYLEITEEHPVYVSGDHRYVRAADLLPGDEVICVGEVSQLRRGLQQKALQQGDFLSASVLRGIPEEEVDVPMCQLRETDLFESGPASEGEAGGVLLSQVSRSIYPGIESPSVSGACEEVLRGMWLRFCGGEKAGEHRCGVQPCVSQCLDEVQQPAEGSQDRVGMRILRNGDQVAAQGGQQESVLLSELREQGSRRADAGGGESKLCGRDVSGRVYQGVHPSTQVDQESRGSVLLSVQQGGVREQAGTRHSPHRLRQDERLQGESGGAVQELPQQPQRGQNPPPSIGTKVVSSVELSVRIPDAVYNVRVGTDHNYFAGGVLVHNCDDPHNVRKAESETDRQNVIDWWDLTMPTRGLSRGARRVVIMQRLHHRDLSGHILASKAPFVHLCLPMRYEPRRMVVTPLGWTDPRKEEGELLTPDQFPEEKVAGLEKSLGAYGTAGQLQQRPQPRSGGLFKPQWFNRRCRAAPREAVRVRGWDRAATADGGCYSAGVLLARTADGTLYVEDVVHGQWEPNERNDRIVATAQRDRLRYGPRFEPILYIEAERGSTGLESFQRLAARLPGFRVREDQPSGSKDVRAEPWSDQLAAGNVVICDGGMSEGTGAPSWDVDGYIQEHLLFQPDAKVKRLGKWKDQVDASSMCCNLIGDVKPVAEIRVIRFSSGDRSKHPRFVVCPRDQITSVQGDERAVIVQFCDPFCEPDRIIKEEPALASVLDIGVFQFADVDPADWQERWQEPVPPYNRPCSEILMTKDHGKAIWRFLLKDRGPAPGLFVLVDPGDKRAESIAKAIVDVLRLPRNASVHFAASDNVDGAAASPAPNKHVYEVMKASRGLLT